MKKYLSLYTLALLMLFFSACDTNNTQDTIVEAEAEVAVEYNKDYMAKNVAIVDAFITSLNSNEYVRSVVVYDANHSTDFPAVFGFEEMVFFDDGTGYDKVAGDGIFTTAETYRHDARVPYNANLLEKSLIDVIIPGGEFTDVPGVKEFFQTYSRKGIPATEDVGIKWKTGTCWCPTECSCLACRLFDTYCFYLYDCEVSISIF